MSSRRRERLAQCVTERGVDGLAVYGAATLGSYGDFFAATGVMPPVKGAIALVDPSGGAMILARTAQDAEGMAQTAPADVTLEHGPDALGPRTARESRRRRMRTIALIGPTTPARIATGLADGLDAPGCLIDGGDLRCLRRVSSPEDLSAVETSADRVRRGLVAAREAIRPGRTQREVAGAVQGALFAAGAVMTIVEVEANGFSGRPPTEGVLHDGDVVTVFVEAVGAEGWWIEAGGALPVGGFRPTHASAAALLDGIASHPAGTRSGSRMSEVARAALARSAGLGATTIGLGHLTGIDEVAEPLTPDSDAVLQAGDLICIHPSARLVDNVALAAANTSLVTHDGARTLIDVSALLGRS